MAGVITYHAFLKTHSSNILICESTIEIDKKTTEVHAQLYDVEMK